MSRGRQAEDLACAWLQRHGLRLLARNHRCRAGELDLVMADGDELVVVEVRYRAGTGFGTAAETVDGRKRVRLLRATRHFLAAGPARGYSAVRFDVVALEGDLAQPRIRWLRDAFTADDAPGYG